MNKVIYKGFRSCRFVSTIVKHPVQLDLRKHHNKINCKTNISVAPLCNCRTPI